MRVTIQHTYSDCTSIQEIFHLRASTKIKSCSKTKKTKNAERRREKDCFKNKKLNIKIVILTNLE